MAMRLAHQGSPEAFGATLGETLGRALFGDPAAAREQQESLSQMALRQAQQQQAEAHARLFGVQADGQGIQNNAMGSLPQLFASMFNPPAPAAPVEMPSDPLAPLPEAAMAPQGFDEATFKAGLPAAIAAMAQSQGDKIDPNGIVGLMAAMFGNDELARRGMVGQGTTPGENFALTPGRADAISARDAGEDHREATDVARINHASDIPVANIKAGADRDVAGIKGNTDRDVAEIKGSGGYDRAGAISLGNTLGRVTSTVRSAKHNKDVGGVSNSFHLASRGGRAVDIARKPGVTHAQVVQAYRDKGYTILESLDEGDHSHLALNGGPAKAKGKAAAPKEVNQADRNMIETIVKARLKDHEGTGNADRFQQTLIRRASQIFQRTGNADDAVAMAWKESGMDKPKGAPQGGPVRVANDADFAKLASGTEFIGPDGKRRVKP